MSLPTLARPGRSARLSFVAMAAFALLALLGLGPARADEASDAAFHDAVGRAEAERGRYVEALSAFLESQRVSPSPGTLYNIGVTAEAAGQLALAYVSLRDYAAEPKAEAGRRADAEARLARLAERLALLRVTTTPPGALVHVDDPVFGAYGRTPLTIPVDPGERRVLVSLEGYGPEEATVATEIGHEAVVEVALSHRLGSLTVEGPRRGVLRLRQGAEPPEERPLPFSDRLPVGTYDLDLVIGGRVLSSRRVVLRPDRPETVRFQAPGDDVPTGRLLVATAPLDAVVFLDGERVGRSPLTVPRVPAGPHRLELRADGAEPVTLDIEIEEGQPLVLRPDVGG
ncbi:MAG: PEGA domain-containing protein [Sandaracinaceae bacterium]